MSGSRASLASHPLVSLLFWALGQDVEGERDGAKKQMDDNDDANDGTVRTLSWKDEKVQGGSLTMTSTFRFEEFADVAGPDMLLRSEADVPLRPKVLHRINNQGEGDADSDAADKKDRLTPNSPNNWGFFVSITPPTAEIFSAAKKGSATSSSSAPPSSSS